MKRPQHFDVLEDGSRRLNALGYKRILEKINSPEFKKAMNKIMKREDNAKK